MKLLLKSAATVMFCSIAIPFFMLLMFPETSIIPGLDISTDEPAEYTAQPQVKYDENTSVLVEMEDKSVKKMNMRDYLIGVVAAEMPASFNIEALKAQAVAARSYTQYKIENFSDTSSADGGHDSGAQVCTDYTHCKAYITEKDLMEMWGESYDTYMSKITQAVTSTDGLILRYGDETVNAVFHSTSSGRTQDAADVWGYDVAYLQSVASPGEELSPSYHSSVTISADEFVDAIKADHVDLAVPDDKSLWSFPLSKTEGGYVISADVFGLNLSGTYMRTLFSLKSSCFDMTFDGENIVFDVLGYGHGVGMSQYGANYLAENGFTYDEILTWYYTDTTVGHI